MLLALSLLSVVFPVVCGVIYSVKAVRYGIRCGRSAIAAAVKKRDDRAYEKYLLEHDEPQIYDVDEIIREVRDTSAPHTK